MLSTQTLIEDNPFLERMGKLEDKELLEVIKNGTNYQPQGVEAAVLVAIKRELISKEEGEKLLGYTLEKIKQEEEEQAIEIRSNRAKGREEMVLGAILFTTGLILTVKSTHYIWVGAFIVGTVLFIRGLFR